MDYQMSVIITLSQRVERSDAANGNHSNRDKDGLQIHIAISSAFTVISFYLYIMWHLFTSFLN